MILGKKKKYTELKAKYELLEEDSVTVAITELYDDGNVISRDLSTIFAGDDESEKWNFLIETQQFRILTEMFLIMPEGVDYEKLEILTHMFYKKIQQFIGTGTEFNQDRILMCKIFLGKQYKHYKDNILEVNDGVDGGELGNLDAIMHWVLSLAETAGNYGYSAYGKEILDNAETQLKRNRTVTNKMLNDIKSCRKSLTNLEIEELYAEKERLDEELKEKKKDIREMINKMIRKK